MRKSQQQESRRRCFWLERRNRRLFSRAHDKHIRHISYQRKETRLHSAFIRYNARYSALERLPSILDVSLRRIFENKGYQIYSVARDNTRSLPPLHLTKRN